MTGYHYVRPHVRRTGTHVRGHYRRNPSGVGGGAAGIIAFLLILAVLHGATSRHPKHATGFQRHSHEATQGRHTNSARRGIVVQPERDGRLTSSGHYLQ